MKWETVVGLEVHVELATRTKIFCSCTTQFGGEPNTHCCPVCMGMPGALPTLNARVVEYAVKAGMALGCRITKSTRLDRKNYFYPDLPKAYQISQLYLPLCRDGAVIIKSGGAEKQIRISEIHIEEDAGKLTHDPRLGVTTADYNRCGVPLIEIVSQPDIRSGEEAVAYLEKLRSVLEYLGVSDCKMQEGSMRADVNLSVRPEGSRELGVRTEMKNLSSFRAVTRAIDYEARRQAELLESGGNVILHTLRWDEDENRSIPMRAKENAQDYRYFPEPDIPPVELSEAWLEGLRESLPELADEKKARYVQQLGLPEYDAWMITSQRALAEFFERTVSLCGRPKEVSNWIMGDMSRLLRERGIGAAQMRLTPQWLAELIALLDGGRINRATARELLSAAFDGPFPIEDYIIAHGLEQVSDAAAVMTAARAALAENQKSADDYRAGKDKALGYLVGQTMRRLGGKADPSAVNRAVRELLEDNSG